MKEEKWEYFDKRQRRPRLIKDLETNVTYLTRYHSLIKYGKSKIDIWPPNFIGIFINCAQKSFETARDIHNSIIKKYQKINDEIELEEQETIRIYDYIENVQISIIMMSTAIEAIINSVIPSNYIYQKREKGEVISYDYFCIQRNINIIEKLKSVLPDALNIPIFTKEKFWSKFQRLIKLRNDLIHMKSNETSIVYDQRQIKNDSDSLIERLFDDNTIGLVQSGFYLIDHLYKNLNKRLDFPIWYNKELIIAEEIESFKKEFTKVRGPRPRR